ncbi:sporulation integral membrane protein YtvI [Anaerocolumna sp. AGMB13025]|uniref:sporulation integral membrane protein YtvI n=1 Tax=Anaerocolumna sp. AGMB13025 TaxID=3039116 RepID=UPI002F3EE36D
MKNGAIYIKIVVNLMIFILGLLFALFLLPKILGFFMPFVIGFIISMIANPLVKFLEKRVKIVRKHSSALIIITVIAVVVGTLYALISIVVKESAQFIQDMPTIYKSMEEQLNEVSEKLKGIYVLFPSGIKRMVDSMNINISEYGSKLMSKDNLPTISEAGTYAKNIIEILLMTIITILSAYFFIAERDNLSRSIRKIMPGTVIQSYTLIIDNFKRAVGGYFKAQFKIMLILIVILFIGFELLKVNYSFLLAVGIAFLDFLPFFGTGAVIWPWALVELLLGNYLKAVLLIVIYLICQIIKQVLQPKMVGDSIGINPFATLIFMFIGYKFLNVLGMIIGIPIGMVLVKFYQMGMFDRVIRGFKIIMHDINEFRKF